MEDQFTITLEGGRPWGFSLQGGVDFRSPLRAGRVTAGGRASQAGLGAGDYILAINEQPTDGMKHLQAQQVVLKSTQELALTCTKKRPWTAPSPLSKIPPLSPLTNGNGQITPTSPTTPKTPRTPTETIAKPRPPPTVHGHHSHSPVAKPKPPPVIWSSPATKANGPVTNQISNGPPQDEAQLESLQSFTVDPAQSQTANGEQGGYPDNKEHIEIDPSEWEMVELPPPDEFQEYQTSGGQDHTGTITEEQEKDHTGTITEEQEKDHTGTITAEEFPPPDEFQEYQTSSGGQDHTGTITEEQEKDHAGTITEEQEKDHTGTITEEFPPPDEFQEYQTSGGQDHAGTITEEQEKDHTGTITEEFPPPDEFQEYQTSGGQDHAGTITEEQEESPKPKPRTKTPPTEADVPVINMDPGRYKEMFQDFQETVEKTFPLASKSAPATTTPPAVERQDESSPVPTYEYDYRGLKVRSDSISKVDEPLRNMTPERQGDSPVPTYEYDYRGLKVRSNSTSKVEDTKQEVKPPPRKTRSPEMTKEDVLAALKQPTASAANYGSLKHRKKESHNYWKKIEQQGEKERRKSEEFRRRSFTLPSHRTPSPDHYSTKMMHPLLREAEEKIPPKPKEESDDVFTRIDATKLHGAMENAMLMGKLEQEGIPSAMLPLTTQKQEQSPKQPQKQEKILKPPPGQKARALFDFDAHHEKELAFKKGDIVNLTHTVDDNWLEGTFDGKKGIFPVAYVRVLTPDQIRDLSSPDLPKPQARALYDFEAQTNRELTFNKGDVLTITRKIDANWYEGCLGENKGIFPTAYIQLLEDESH